MNEEDIEERKIWWIEKVVMRGIGIYIIILRKEIWEKVIGMVLIVEKNIYGEKKKEDI